MKGLASLLVAAASVNAVAPQQQVLQAAQAVQDKTAETASTWTSKLEQLGEQLKSTTHDVQGLFDEVMKAIPKDVSFKPKSAPKPHSRKPDHEWDHITSGQDIQSVWVEGISGEKEREIDGPLEAYTMRTKKVDPKSLGVDNVKQYSGYLDDNEEDKHLFYCKST